MAGRAPARRAAGQAGLGTVAVGVSHYGAGCTLGDIVAECTVFLAGITIAGEALWAELSGDYVLALALGLLLQYRSSVTQARLGGVRRGGVTTAHPG